jgi:HD-GYP domain-containing protein (c-di-GMP phosphodiesterase class II)
MSSTQATPPVNTRPKKSVPAKPLVQSHFRIPVAKLTLGMWVAQLDKPWVDTPFLIQGFEVDSDTELQNLREYCRFVYVDLNLSKAEVAGRIRDSEQLADDDKDATPKGQFQSLRGAEAEVQAETPNAAKTPLPASGKHRVKMPEKAPAASQQRFRDFVRSSTGAATNGKEADVPIWKRLWSGLNEMFSGGGKSSKRRSKDIEDGKRELQLEIKSNLPAGTKLVRYAEGKSVPEELPRARSALKSSESTLKRVLQDIRSGAIPDIEKVQGSVDDMVESMVSNPDAMMWIARLRDEDSTTYSHGVRVSLYMVSLGRHLGFPKEQLGQLGMIGMLADVGKLNVARALLEKPGMLTPKEHDAVKMHVQYSIEALNTTGKLPPEVEMGILQHHERMDGSGYPAGLKADAISVYGRIAGIADCFSALTTSRPYANAQAPQDALVNMYHWAGTSFHEALVEQFVQSIGVFPVGTLVELSSGEIAVVVAQNRVRRLEPKVLMLTWPDKRPLSNPVERDLFQSKTDEQGQRLRIARGLPMGAFGLKLRDYYADNVAHANNLI